MAFTFFVAAVADSVFMFPLRISLVIVRMHACLKSGACLHLCGGVTAAFAFVGRIYLHGHLLMLELDIPLSLSAFGLSLSGNNNAGGQSVEHLLKKVFQ